MKSLLYLLSHTTIQLRFVSLLSNSIILLLAILIGFCSWTAFVLGAAAGFLWGVLFWYETREPLYKNGEFPVTVTQKFSYLVLFLLYAIFLGCLVERMQMMSSPGWVKESLRISLCCSLGFLLVYTLSQLTRLTHYVVKGGILERFIWKVRQTGEEGMIGLKGIVKTKLDPDGTVFLRGELWQAVATGDTPLESGCRVRVERIEGLTLYVSPEPSL